MTISSLRWGLADGGRRADMDLGNQIHSFYAADAENRFPIGWMNRLERIRAALIALPYPIKRLMAVGLDVLLCLLSVPIALYLRLGELPQINGGLLAAEIMTMVVAPSLLALFGTYRVVFRYVGWFALMAIARGIAIYGIPFLIIFSLIGWPGIPRTIGIIQPIMLFLMIGGARGFISLWLGGDGHVVRAAAPSQRILIYGAGQAGRQLAGGLLRSRQHEVLGFVDDSPTLIGRTLHGKPIYDPAELREVQEKLVITDLLLALPSISRSRRAAIIESVRRLPIHVRTLPGISELASGKVSTTDLRELEVDDLLGRESVPPNIALLRRNVHQKTVLVTGAGGSIGGEICRQVIATGPSRLILLDNSEYALYAIHQQLSEFLTLQGSPQVEVVQILASVCDEKRIDEILRRWSPDTIYHAAAYKHVPLIEHNPLEGIRNNVLGTLITARLAERHNVGIFVLISTDKAVRPTNIMGASKRLAEQILQARAGGCGTRLAMVRFGNVLGSSGSVVPLFRRQISRGGPVTLTHPDIIRYFMTIPEAAQLVIQAGALASGGEIFVLDMGSPVRIMDLARNMIELSGLTVKSAANPDGDIEIAITSMRPGEKLYEELLIGDDPHPTSHPRIMTARDAHPDWSDLRFALDRLRQAIDAHDTVSALRLLRQLVPEYAPDERIITAIAV